MTLNNSASYPQATSFVLMLHRDAAPAEGNLVGRLEHLATGQRFHFASADELIECLVAGAALAVNVHSKDER
jgi:hypothetical protein